LYIEGVCADEADEDMNGGLHQRPEATSTGPGGAFDSKWVPPVGGGAPSRHTGTGGAADGVHEDRLRESGGGVEWCPDASS
jgi:hypothetical protein